MKKLSLKQKMEPVLVSPQRATSTTWTPVEPGVEAIAYFKIFSTVKSPEDIERAIGLCPDRSWNMGDPIQKTLLVFRHNGCLFKSKLPKNASLEDQVRELLRDLEPHAEKIRALSNAGCDLEMSCVIHCSDRPILSFDREIVAAISNLGASLDIDLYILPEEGDVS